MILNLGRYNEVSCNQDEKMEQEVLKDYGWCQVIKKGTNYYLKFDKGGVVIQMATYKISESQAIASIANEIETENIAKSLLIGKAKEEIGSL